MVALNKFAVALAVIGSGAVVGACASQQATSHAVEVPAPGSKEVSASCGASGGGNSAEAATAGAEAAIAAVPVAEDRSPAGSEPVSETTSAGSTRDEATAPSGSTSAEPVAAKTASSPARKKKAKKTGAEGGCGQGSCG
jgi:hypothetical protein